MKLVNGLVFVCITMFSTLTFANQFYLGTDFSNMRLDQAEFDSVNVNSILAGYEFGNWAIEGSYNTSQTHNKFYGGDQKINMYHLYSVYRSEGALYYKIKLGLSNERYKFYDDNDNLHLDDVHTGVARGIGVGYRLGQFNLEMEYSWLGRSLETVGVGVRYYFN